MRFEGQPGSYPEEMGMGLNGFEQEPTTVENKETRLSFNIIQFSGTKEEILQQIETYTVETQKIVTSIVGKEIIRKEEDSEETTVYTVSAMFQQDIDRNHDGNNWGYPNWNNYELKIDQAQR